MQHMKQWCVPPPKKAKGPSPFSVFPAVPDDSSQSQGPLEPQVTQMEAALLQVGIISGPPPIYHSPQGSNC